MKLSKADAKLHQQAVDVLNKPGSLSVDEREFVLEHWREDAEHVNSTAGAFFTPLGLAGDLAIEVTGGSVVDLCAGIGALAYACLRLDPTRKIVCVELNRAYYEVGRRVVPEAEWICADAFGYETGKVFDCAISNPPFGNVNTHKNKYGKFEYDLIAHARAFSKDGVFIVPQVSAPFRFSGQSRYEVVENAQYEKFSKATGVRLGMNCGIDTSIYDDQWSIKPPRMEIVLGYETD